MKHEHLSKDKKRKRTISSVILFSLMVMLLIEIGMLASAIFASHLPQKLNSNAEAILCKQVENRQNYLENFLLRAQEISDLSNQINEETQRLLDAGAISLDTLDENSASSLPLLQSATELLLRDLRTKSVTGAFIVLNTHNLDNCPDGSRLPGIYLRDLNPDAPASERNEDVSFEFAPSDVVQSMRIYTDDCWQPNLVYSRESCAFVYEPFQAAWNSSLILEASDYGRWTTEPFTLPDDNRQVITYSQPLILPDGTVYGVVGVELLCSYLGDKLPYSELHESNTGAYLLAVADGTAEDGTELSLQNVLCAAEDAAENTFAAHAVFEENEQNEWFFQNNTEYFAYAIPLSLYSRNAPFFHEQWMLVGMVPDAALFSFPRTVQNLLLVTVLLTLLVGVICSIIISTKISRPITRLSSEIAQAEVDSGTIPHLSQTGIAELDQFSAAFTHISQDVLDTSTKFLRIIDMASVALGGYEIREDSESIYVTKNLFSLLGLPNIDPKALTKAQFSDILQELIYRSNELSLSLPPEEGEDEDDEDDREHVISVPLPNGETRYVLLRISEEDGIHVGLAEDVTNTVKARQRLEHERDFDLLTELYSRRAFNRRGTVLFQWPDILKHAALLMMDMDNLKQVNDTFGHNYGDRYIRLVGQYLSENAPQNAICARLSGDEFVVLLYGYESREALALDISHLHKAMDHYSLPLSNGTIKPLRLSTGVSWYPEDSTKLPLLQKYADFAMYQTKREQKGGITSFDISAYQAAENSDELRREFQQMLEDGFVPYHFQPIFRAENGSVFAYEALMRPDMPALRNPAQVLDLARETNQLYDVERLTVFNATTSYDKGKKEGTLDPGSKLFLNSISSVYLSDEDFSIYESQHSDTIDNIVVEITEEEDLDYEILSWKRRQLNGHGSFALDDYGSGYSNSANLLEMAPDYIKVDLSIIRDINISADKQEIVRTLVDYAHPRGMQVVAEGIETAAELRCVIDLQVDLLQGYFLSRPASAPRPIAAEAKAVIDELQQKHGAS